MKTLALILSLLLCFTTAHAQTIVNAVVTVTNTTGTANGETITVNGATRTWTNSLSSYASQILTNNTIAGSASNLFLSFASSRAPSSDIFLLSTNAITFRGYVGSPMAVTISAGWGTVTLSTNTLTTSTPMRSPMSATGPIEQTNTASGIVDYLNVNKATSAVSASATALSNHVNNATAQTIGGAKTFTGPITATGANVFSNPAQVFNGGTITNATISNCVPALTNGYWSDGVLTNGQNFGLPFRSPGGGTGSEQFGLGALATVDQALALGAYATASGLNASAVGNNSVASGGNATALGYLAAATNAYGIALGYLSSARALGSLAVGALAISSNQYSSAIGVNSVTTADHQIRLGTSAETVSIPGSLQVDGSISNATFAGSVTLNNELLITSFNSTSLATGNNSAVNISSNAYVTITSGPSGAFTIAGIAGGVDKRVVTLQNTTGQNMVIADNSGIDPTAGNRIRTGLSGDYTCTNNPGVISFRYDGNLSKWVLNFHN